VELRDVRFFEFILTAGCNLRCSYCYQSDKKARSMEWPTLRASLDVLLASASDDIGALFIGGEPMLQFPLIEQAVAYLESRRRAGMRIAYDLITNGMLVDDQHADFFAAHDFSLQLSFDGVPAAQDLRARGSFTRLDRLLDRLKDRHPGLFSKKLRVSLTLLPSTLQWFPDSIAYFLSKNVREIQISPALTATPDWRTNRIEELDLVFKRAFGLSVEYYHRTGRVPLVAFREAAASPLAGGGEQPMCLVARGGKLAVDVDGQALGCATFATSYQSFPTVFLRNRIEALRMGHVTRRDLADVVRMYPDTVRQTGLFHDHGAKFSSYGRCRECRYLATCGFCPVSIGHQPGNEDPDRVPDWLCAFNLVSNAYREKFPKMTDTAAALLQLVPGPRLDPEFAELFFHE
jgi:sulfatase maturation enzyme AslB (radical SAM superfamily)